MQKLTLRNKSFITISDKLGFYIKKIHMSVKFHGNILLNKEIITI